MIKNSIQRKTRSIKQQNNLNDHTENDFEDCDKLITNLCGRRVELNNKQQKEVLEFIYAIGSCREDIKDPLKHAMKYSDVELRALLLTYMKNIIYSASSDKLLEVTLEFLSYKEAQGKMTIN
jgi:hypothetical protein